MKHLDSSEWFIIQDNISFIERENYKTGERIRQGKRIAKANILHPSYHKLYTKKGSLHTVVAIRSATNLPLHVCRAIFVVATNPLHKDFQKYSIQVAQLPQSTLNKLKQEHNNV